MAPTLVLTFLLALGTGLVALAFVSRRSHLHYSPVVEALVPPLMFYNLWILLRLFIRFADSGALGAMTPGLGRMLMTGLITASLLVVIQLGATYLAFAIRASHPDDPGTLLQKARRWASFLALGTVIFCLTLFALHRDPWIRLFGRSLVALAFLIMAGLSLWIAYRAHRNHADPSRRNLEVLGTAYFILFGALALFILWYRFSAAVAQSTYVSITVALEIVFNLVTVLWIRFFDQGVAAPAPGALEAPQASASKPSLSGAFGISKREEEVILLVCQGLTNQEIADALFISLKTVKDHNYRIFQKTGVRNRVELAQLVRRLSQEREPEPLTALPQPSGI